MLLTSPLSSPLKNPVRDLFSPAGGAPLSLTAQVQALFAGGKVGGMWDMGDLSTLFQDTAGVTPVTTAAQSIALVLDKGKALGSESLVNGDYASGTSNWTIAATGTAVVNAGVLRVTSTTGRGTASQSFTTVIGQKYRVRPGLISNGNAGAGAAILRITSDASYGGTLITQAGSASSNGYIFFTATTTTTYIWLAENTATSGNYVDFGSVSVKADSGNHATQSTAINRSLYQVVGGYGCAQFDATDDALLFPAIAFGGAFNTFVAGKLTGGTIGVHLWRTADFDNGYWGVYQSGSATSPTGISAGSPTYSNNGIAVSPQTRAQIYTLINGVDSVLESTGIVLSAETALQFSGYPSAQFQGNAHRVLMISGTLTAGEKLLCRQWAAEGNGATVV